MIIADGLIAELRGEAPPTRKYLEIIPEADWDWKPHEKSYSLGQLGSHIAESLQWVGATVETDELVFDPAEYKPFVAANCAELLAAFDNNMNEAVKALDGKTDEEMLKIWCMRTPEKVFFEMPRVAVLRAMIINHGIHHRGQLSVYLRLRDVPLPSIYGPTADNPM
jgi:uncharacterized damage-inducible protein DinB